jgi:glutamyl-tRNA reductase
VLIVGAGEMAELTARHLMSQGVTRLLVANRTLDRARQLAWRLQGQGIALADLPSHLPQADIVISSTGAPAPLIGPAEVQSALR